MLRRDKAGRWRTEGGGFASKEQIARARVYLDPSGRKRPAPKTKEGRKPRKDANKPKAKVKGRRGQKLRAAFKPKDPVKRAAAREKIKPRAPAAKRPAGITLRVNPNALGGAPGKRAAELADKFGIRLRSADDFASLVELQGVELARGSFTTEDPSSKEHREGKTILRAVRRTVEQVFRKIEGGTFVNLSTRVNADGEDLGEESIIVRAPGKGGDEGGVHGVAGGVLAAIFSILGQHGYEGSDGVKAAKDGRSVVDELEVELVAYGL